ncbi:pseudaminic acid synthase [Sphingobacterium sp. B29]|uniref:pseudaminic acid synthase n=1 Tax=Sphingobacterium sp. B29 TaxID=1933220 RepID=UPI000958AD9C|nr:pseudaminic acid synthase [Sphingobacterium sp. B29]APU95269.1 pseudaminic acid synthase [Sphingobacterium sp. B29]
MENRKKFDYTQFKENGELFIIAELSANHNNEFDLAIRTIDAIAATGADAVKVQTFTPDSLTLDVDNEYFGPRKDGLWKGKRPYDLYQVGMLPFEWHEKLKKHAESLGLFFFSSPFDSNCVEFLESLDVPMYKIASAEITDIDLIRSAASKGKPVIISTGMAGLEDVELAIETCLSVGNDQVILLKCTSEYPAPIDMANLSTIPMLREKFDVVVGVSDHTMGNIVPTVAVAMGGQVIEKHIILSRDLGGIDSQFSMEPDEFKEMVDYARMAAKSIGKPLLDLSEKNKLRRRSIFVAADILAGEELSIHNMRVVRPGHGLAPKYMKDLLGRKVKYSVKKGTPLDWNMLIENDK